MDLMFRKHVFHSMLVVDLNDGLSSCVGQLSVAVIKHSRHPLKN